MLFALAKSVVFRIVAITTRVKLGKDVARADASPVVQDEEVETGEGLLNLAGFVEPSV